MRKDSGDGLMGAAKYLGGMGMMGATEALKFSPTAQHVASKAYNAVQGTPNAPDFFGGEDTSKPNLASLAASHYGAMREPEKEAPIAPRPGYGLQGASIQPAQEDGIMAMIRRILSSGAQ
jgi:hypothetical protein